VSLLLRSLLLLHITQYISCLMALSHTLHLQIRLLAPLNAPIDTASVTANGEFLIVQLVHPLQAPATALPEEEVHVRESNDVEDSEPDPDLPTNVFEANGAGVHCEEGHQPLRRHAEADARVAVTKGHGLGDVDVLQ
jgi:hypothetical protein